MAVVLLVVIGVSVAATLYVTGRKGGRGATASTSGTPSDYASANDTGPVSIITDEPTCGAYQSISDALSQVESKSWGKLRGSLESARGWTFEERTAVEEVAEAMREAAAKTGPLVSQTPNRLIKELYELTIAYGRAYADSIETYRPSDDGLASANVNAGSAIVGICNAIAYGSLPMERPRDTRSATQSPTIGSPINPQRLITVSSPMCSAWITRLDEFAASTPKWQVRDTATPAAGWTPEQRTVEHSTRPLLMRYANDTRLAVMNSGNKIVRDIGYALADYIDAYLSIGDAYNGAGDSWFSFVAFRLANLVAGACRAVAD